MGSRRSKDAALKWLSSQGSLLEMKVAKRFSENNFEVISSSIYEDPITKVGREIDVIASKGKLLEKHIVWDITFVIECKYSKDKPWVLFRSSEQKIYGKNYDITFRSASYHAQVMLLELETSSNDLKGNFLFSFNNNLYYGLKRVHSESDRMVNEAINQVCNAVHARRLMIDSFNTSLITNLELQFPILVVQGNLFEAYLDDRFELVLNEADFGHFFTTRPELGNKRFYIDIVTLDYLDEYIKKISQAAKEILSYSDCLEGTKKYIRNRNLT
jgi:hypothetical protein